MVEPEIETDRQRRRERRGGSEVKNYHKTGVLRQRVRWEENKRKEKGIERDKQITDTVSMDERREDCGQEERVRRK